MKNFILVVLAVFIALPALAGSNDYITYCSTPDKSGPNAKTLKVVFGWRTISEVEKPEGSQHCDRGGQTFPERIVAADTTASRTYELKFAMDCAEKNVRLTVPNNFATVRNVTYSFGAKSWLLQCD